MTAVATVVLASPADDPLIETIAAALLNADIPVTVVGLNAAAADDAAHEAQFLEAIAAASGDTIIGGFSLGGRIAANLCADVAPRGLLCFGYPFHAAKEPKERRGLEALSRLQLPTRIIQGTRDNHGSAADVRSYGLPGSVEMVWLNDGNHRLVPRERSGHTHEELVRAAAASAISFVRRVCGQ